ncbi:MAG: 6-bladed beta-propeller [Dysgonamonadaceae bacterium]|jgi:hypothetical protein|nr:6-bladed beta-propeller [Dysgonamonadaceae bacterium]
MKLFLIIILALNSFCCQSINKEESIDDPKIIKIALDIKKELVDTVCFQHYQVVKLETNEHSLLRKIDRICNHDNKLFILDNSLDKLVIFDMQGKYQANVQRIGNGPAEYIGAVDFCLDTTNRHILLLCDKPYKIMKFDYAGNFIDEKKTNELFLNIVSGETRYYCNRPDLIENSKNQYELARMDLNCRLTGNFLKIGNSAGNNFFFPGKGLTSTKNIYYTRRFDNAIYQVDNGKVESKYKIDFRQHSLPDDLLEKSPADFNAICREKRYIYGITNVAESDKFIMFGTNLCLFMLNKANSTIEGYETVFNSDLKISSNAYFPIGYNDQAIAVTLEPIYLCKVKEIAKEYAGFDNQTLLRWAEGIEEDDNPILLLYHFK